MYTKEDRFDLEDKITSMLNINDDLSVFMKSMYDNRNSLTEDQALNALIGIMELHRQRHDLLWRQFSQMIKNKQITDPKETDHEMAPITN